MWFQEEHLTNISMSQMVFTLEKRYFHLNAHRNCLLKGSLWTPNDTSYRKISLLEPLFFKVWHREEGKTVQACEVFIHLQQQISI